VDITISVTCPKCGAPVITKIPNPGTGNNFCQCKKCYQNIMLNYSSGTVKDLKAV